MELKVAFLAINEHGDCSVITFGPPDSPKCIVIDGGEGKNGATALRAYLKKANIRSIDLMIGTHLDEDHINGLKLFVQAEAKARRENKPYTAIQHYWGPLPSSSDQPRFTVQTVSSQGIAGSFSPTQQYLMESIQQNEDLLAAIQEMVPASRIHFPSRQNVPPQVFTEVDLRVIGPDVQVPASTFEKKAMTLGVSLTEGAKLREGMDISELANAVNSEIEALAQQLERTVNNQSIVVHLLPSQVNKDWSFLFTGDATQGAWKDMVNDPQVRPLLRAKVLKIPHHGSALNGITKDGIDAVKPDYSVNMVGNKHGLPDAPTLALIRKAGCKILCTQQNSDPKKKSACYSVPQSNCPAKANPKDIIFTIDTSTGSCKIDPPSRDCLNPWQ